METRRALEIFGAMAFGAGVAVAIYEFSAAPSGGGGSQRSADPVAEGEEGLAAAAGGSAGSDEEAGASPVAADEAPATGGPFAAADAEGHYGEFPPVYAPPVPLDAEAEAKFVQHGLVTGGAVAVRERPDLESPRIGVVRARTRLRVDRERTFGGGCSQGWHEIHRRGWVCLNAGLAVGPTPLDDGTIDVGNLDLDAAMPLDYWRVKDNGTPFFHRLPTFAEQDEADAAATAWIAERGSEPMPTHPEQRPKEVPGAVKEYLNAGYYVTIASEHERMKRRFLRTNRGSYARKYQLEKRDGSDFRGRVLPRGEEDLPIYWITREMPLEQRASAGSGILVDTEVVPPRRSTYPFVRAVRIGDSELYEDDAGRLLHAYAVGRSYKLERPPGISQGERWIHVDLSEQTLVAYVGDRPVFTTLVSTGKDPGMTPVGVHRIQMKHIVTSMRDQPIEDEAYSIEDVPWTQYFSNNVALHGAFWHGGFGLVRSHGCVNISPADARWLFGFTAPALPDGWHAIAGDDSASAVVITE